MISLERMRVPPIPRLPLVPDPLRRIRVPRDLDAVTARAPEAADVEALGMTAAGIERIWSGVERLYRSGMYPAIALCVRRQGQVVLDRAIGHARGNGPADGEDAVRTPATPETPFVIFSASKAMTAVVAHLLEERGLLHLDDRVCEYIPEYAAHGKDAITIGHLLSHRAGVPNLPPPRSTSTASATGSSPGAAVRRQARLASRQAALLPRGVGRLRRRRDRPSG